MTEAPLVCDLLRSAAREVPDRVLVADQDGSLSAGDLWGYTSRLAGVLPARGVDVGDRVAVIAQRSAPTVRLVVALLALGRVPLVVDPRRDDIAHRLSVGRPEFVLDERGMIGIAPTDFDGEVEAAVPVEPTSPERTGAAYVMFTSGTTATAKGVVTTQHGLAQGAADWLDAYGAPPPDTGGALQFAGTGFDVFYEDIVRALAGRYRLVICPEDVRVDPPRLLALLREERIGTAEFTPALGRLLLDELEASGADLPDLHQIAFGGEGWRVAQLRRALRLLPGRQIVNTYGLVETTVDNFLFVARDTLPELPDEQLMPIGVPFRGCDVLLVDLDSGEPAQDEGELWIGGSYVAAGYIDQNRRVDKGALAVRRDGDTRDWFPTGDLVRRDADGTYWYLGRIGSMVKVHGQRLDLGAVDAVVTGTTGGCACSTVLLDDQETLMTVIAAGEDTPLDADHLRAEVTRRLGPLATPARILRVPDLPLNPNGKLDRRAIVRMADAADRGSSAVADASGSAAGGEQGPLAVIRDFCRDELGIAQVAPGARVADLGLDSLRIVRLLAVLGRRYECRLPVELVFSGPTAAEIAVAVEARRGRDDALPQREEHDWYPLTHAQQELLMHSALHADPAAYVVPLVLELTGPVDLERLERALRAVVAAHEPLHSRYVWSAAGDGWRAEVADPELILAISDDPDVSLADLLAEPFDLASEPPIRAWFLRDRPGAGRLVLAIHHVATDAGSTQLLLDRLAEELRTPGAVSAPVPSYGDLAAGELPPSESDLSYWRGLLAGLAPAAPRDPERAGPARRLRRRLSPQLAGEVHAAAREHGCTVFALTMAALAECERRWSESEDVLIGYPVTRRESAAAESLIGMFVDTAVCRLRLPPAVTGRAMIQAVREQVAQNGRRLGSACQQVLQEQTRGTGRPAFATWLNFIGEKERAPQLPSGVSARILAADELPGIFERTFYIHDDADGLEIVAVAAAGVPGEVAAGRLDQFHRMIERIVRAPDEPLADADVSPPVPPVVRIPVRPRNDVLPFAETARRWPDRIALVDSERSMSYRELADAVQVHRAQGTLREMTRTAEAVVALLAGLGQPGLTALWDPSQPEAWRDGYLESVRAAAGPGDGGARYALPTSGSSAAPQAVVSDVDTLLRVLEDYREALSVTPDDRFLLTAGLAHDPVLRDTLAPLLVGGSLSVPDRRQWHDPSALVDVIRATEPTILNLTPQVSRLLVAAADGAGLESVTRIVLSGDVLRPDDLPGLRRTFPAAALFHGYGLTQTPQLAALQPLDDDGTEILIGPARPGSRLLVVDESGRPCALGQPGEIVVQGQLLASGLSAPVIQPALEDADRPVRMLATGDRGELVGGGMIRYLGRANEQVSVNGHLFDPGVVDRVLADHPDVDQSATIVLTDHGHDHLITAVVARGGAAEADLGQHLRRRLPVGLAPARIVTLDRIPRGVNGKVDRRALHERLRSAAGPTAQSVPPRTETERAVARIWQRHLRATSLGVDDNFFDLGGTSLLLLRVHAELARRWTALPDVVTFYERPTVAGLAAEIDARHADEVTGRRGRSRVSRHGERERRTAARRAARARQESDG